MKSSLRTLFASGLLLATCIATTSCGKSAASPSSGSSTGDAMDFTLTDVEGKSVSLSTYLGKSTIVLSFWATWCKPCAAELQHLDKMYREKKDKGFVVLAISLDGPETEAGIGPFVKAKGYSFPILIDNETRASQLYNPRRAAPFTVIINSRGKVVKQRETFNPGDEVKLEADIAAAMGGGEAVPAATSK